jgi:elongation factor Ts
VRVASDDQRAPGNKRHEATINATLVKKLRDRTGAGVIDCKNALTETQGDFEAAVERLRAAEAAKAARRSTGGG